MKKILIIGVTFIGYAALITWSVNYSLGQKQTAKTAYSIKTDSIKNAKSVEYFGNHSEIK